jgi:predicted metal-dependent hydrolase
MRNPQIIVDEAKHLFNAGKFWHVHESLEELWKERQGPEKELLQGLILVAASLVHAGNGKMEVAWPMLERALKKLEGQPEVYYGWNVAKFRTHFAQALADKKLEIPTV